jgi:hypothetical protein
VAILPEYVIPVNLGVSADILTGLVSGELVRHNGVVRNTAGEIVTHLKEVAPDGSEAGESLAQFAQPINAKIVIGTLVVVAVAAGGTALFWRRKRQKEASTQAASCATTYNATLVRYLAAIRNQTLDQEVIDELVDALDDVLAMAGTIDVEIVVGPSGIQELLAVVADYTRELAIANEQAQPDIEMDDRSSFLSPVTELRQYLITQREILDRAA